jgi:hypothetical protein
VRIATVWQARSAVFPPPSAWRAAFGGRQLPGVAVSIVGAWFGVPFILIMAMLGGIVGGVSGTVSGTFVGSGVLSRLDKLLTFVFPLPVKAGDLLPVAAAQIGGIVGGLIGAVSGAAKMAWMAGVWPWQTLYEGDPLWPWELAVGNIVTAYFLGWLFVASWSAAEPLLWRTWGNRRMSRREREFLWPILTEAAARLDIKRPPELMIHDGVAATAETGIRLIGISRGMLRMMEHDRDMIAAILAWHLARWKAGHPIAALFTRGVGLPLYLLYELAFRLVKHTPWRPMQWLFRVLLWSVLTTVNYLVRPFHSRSIRSSYFEADAAVVRAGYGRGLRRALLLFQQFESGRDGWGQTMLSLSPTRELRLERLQEPGRRYHLDEDYRLFGSSLGSPQSSVERTD